jgi:limonene-1,2-epoxide hydrolase
MSVNTDSPAVALVRAHMEAYSNQDLDTARGNVAENVECYTNEVTLSGIDEYMVGLSRFAAIVSPGSLNVIAARGDDRKAMIMAEHTIGGQAFPSARTFELDDNGKIKVERVVFFGPPAA